MWRYACAFLTLVAASRQVTITDFVVPNAVKLGEDALLQCRYSLEENEKISDLFFVKWWWTPHNASKDQRHQIYQRITGYEPQTQGYPGHYTVINIKPNDTIELLNLQPVDSGIYECEVSDINESHMPQELIVFTEGSGVQLNISMVADGPDEDEVEDVLVTCEVENVAPEPELVISLNGGILEIDPGDKIITGPESGLYNITANVTISKGEASGAKIRCELFFNNTNIAHNPYFAAQTYVEDDGGIRLGGSWTVYLVLLLSLIQCLN